VADLDRNDRPICVGISGRFQSEWVAELDRNQWPVWCGISNEWHAFAELN
jgi:hypothetical protein